MNFTKLAVFAISAALAAPTAIAQTVSLGTNPQGSVAFAAGSAIAKVAIEKGDIRMRVVPQGGPNVVFPLVNAGELNFGVANGTVANFAYRGVEEFDTPNENIRFVARLFPLYAGFIVRGDSDIHTLSDLKSRVVPSAYINQMTLVNSSDAVLSTVGLSTADVDGAAVPNGVRGVQDLEEGKVEATWFSTTSGRVMQADAAITGGIRVLPVENTPENDALVAQVAPGASIEDVAPGPSFPGVDETIGTFVQPFVLVANSDTPDDVVYAVVKALHENKEALAISFGSFTNFDPNGLKVDVGVPVHPGAAKFFAENGM